MALHRLGSWLLCSLFLAGCQGPGPGGAGAPTWPKASRAPIDLTFQDLETERAVRLSDLRGKPVVLFFFTTWCVPCQLQAERLHQVHAAVGRDRVRVLGVALDLDRRLVGPFVEAAGFNFPVVLGETSLVRSSPIGPVQGVPRLVILDAHGRPAADFPRPTEGRPLYQVLRALLRR
jgi:thiol-disulfide isomerase/thioredoxin